MNHISVPRELLEQIRGYLQTQCGLRCNAEYNPCWAQELDMLLQSLQPNTQEPAAYVSEADINQIVWMSGGDQVGKGDPLYAHPAPHAETWVAGKDYTLADVSERTPLTDDQIYELYSEPRSDAEMVAFARAVEAAHGIGGEV